VSGAHGRGHKRDGRAGAVPVHIYNFSYDIYDLSKSVCSRLSMRTPLLHLGGCKRDPP
jgi:hypothetical protein